MDTKDYLQNPCGASSLPFWKTERITVPENMRVLRDGDHAVAQYAAWHDERYFKLRHDLKDTERPVLPDGYFLADADAATFASHIGDCYDEERVTATELEAYRTHPVYDSTLWLALAERGSGAIVASGVAELDRRIGEGIIEWIQVSPACRRQGLGAFVVRELLWRMKEGGAVFATVSGKMDSRSKPLALYEACGFGGKAVWHVLTK